MLYSRSTKYAIQALLYLSLKNSRKPTAVEEIAQANKIPKMFLSKILLDLCRYGILASVRGRTGGIVLNKKPEEIFISEVVQILDGLDINEEDCVIGLDSCTPEQPCPFHTRWHEIQNDIRELLYSESLAELTESIINKHNGLIEKDFPLIAEAIQNFR